MRANQRSIRCYLKRLHKRHQVQTVLLFLYIEATADSADLLDGRHRLLAADADGGVTFSVYRVHRVLHTVQKKPRPDAHVYQRSHHVDHHRRHDQVLRPQRRVDAARRRVQARRHMDE